MGVQVPIKLSISPKTHLVDRKVLRWRGNGELLNELVHLVHNLGLPLERLDALLDLIQEGQTLYILQGLCGYKLQFKLSVLQLGDETVHFLTCCEDKCRVRI